ncbi:MAG: GbsR/MarR family transcriptional regulator [Pseudonocardiaceae bacterium]
MTGHDSTDLHGYAEEVGLYFADKGLPRMPGRILGWLLVCEPPHQSAEELATVLSASRGSISMAVRMLLRTGAVERYAVPGSRRTYYRVRPGFWLREAEEKARVASEARKLAEHGLGLLAGRDEESRRRLTEMRDMYTFLETEYARIEARWHERLEESG